MNLEFISKCVSYLGRNKWIPATLITLILAVIMFLIGWNLGYSSYRALLADYNTLINSAQTLQYNYDEIISEYATMRLDYKTTLDELCELKAKYGKAPEEVITYSYFNKFASFDVAAAGVTLGKGDKFEAHMIVWKAEGCEPVLPLTEGEIVFWIRGPSYKKVVDTGRVHGESRFGFVAEESGEYQLIFDDRDQKCFIEFYYNSPGKIWDISVLPGQ